MLGSEKEKKDGRKHRPIQKCGWVPRVRGKEGRKERWMNLMRRGMPRKEKQQEEDKKKREK